MIDKYKLLISLIYSYKGYSNEKKKIRYKNDYESAMKEIEQIEHPTLLKTKIKMKKML